jgi:mannosylglucosylglycerate synthase
MKTAIIHYSAPPTVGGVEMVIQAHAEQFAHAGLPLTIISGRGDSNCLPESVEFIKIDEIDTLFPAISSATQILNSGVVPDSFEDLSRLLINRLEPVLSEFDHVIVHNILTKHFNLPLTAALFHLIKTRKIKHGVAWCHDLTWSSTRSRNKVFPAYPWDLLKTFNDQITYVAISEQRKMEVVETMGCPPEKVRVIYNGVDPKILLGLSPEIAQLITRLDITSVDLILLMPVRITRAKNIELAIQVISEIKKLGHRPKLILTGPPDPHDLDSVAYFTALLKMRHELGVESEFVFIYESGIDKEVGWILNRTDVSEIFRIADAVFMPSHQEGFGMPLLEAAFVGLPLISTGIPSLKEIIGNNALEFSPKDNPKVLAKRIVDWLMANPDVINRVKMRQNFTWKAIFDGQILPVLQTGRINP